jgi:hypothetical protein
MLGHNFSVFRRNRLLTCPVHPDSQEIQQEHYIDENVN